MRKLFLSHLIIVLSICVFAQNRIANGYVLDKESHIAIEGALVEVIKSDINTLSDESGSFSIDVPKKHRWLLVSKENYKEVKIPLKPGFKNHTIRAYLVSKHTQNKAYQKELKRDSLFRTYKNALSLSMLELLAVAIAPRYERFLTPRHSVGIHTSFYVYGRNAVALGSEHDIYPVYQGFKLAPGYRFYIVRRKVKGLFAEAKIPFGFINFSKLDYHSTSYSGSMRIEKQYSFWTAGYSFTVGVMLSLPKTAHGVINISIGYQFFPIDVPAYASKTLSSGYVLTMPTDTYWWYSGGPGTPVEIKFSIGGIF